MKSDVIRESIGKSKGRIFGMETHDGRKMNARLIKTTDRFVKIWDNNQRKMIQVSKENIRSVNYSGKFYL